MCCFLAGFGVFGVGFPGLQLLLRCVVSISGSFLALVFPLLWSTIEGTLLIDLAVSSNIFCFAPKGIESRICVLSWSSWSWSWSWFASPYFCLFGKGKFSGALGVWE